MSKKLLFLPVLLLVFSFFAQPTFALDNPHIPDSYIVVFNDDVASPPSVASDIARQHGLSIAFTYSHALKGFSAVIPAGRLNAVKNDPRVRFISEDRLVFADKPGVSAKPTPTPVPTPSQTVPTGISRIGQSTTYSGAGIGVAVIDTGIDLDHPDLVVSGNKTCVTRTSTGNDDNGHGTHVAGTIAARNNSIGVVGVAPESNLYAVKVLDRRGSGSWSSVICGINWVTGNAQTLGIKVANMSLGGSGTSDGNCETTQDALHLAICNSSKAGVTYVVAAGNSGADAANSVPAAYDDTVITVSALVDTNGAPGGGGDSTSYGADDTFASFSNFGSVVDIGAPGVNIRSTWKDGGYNTISGTSMATPHVAGVVALYRQSNLNASLSEATTFLVNEGELIGQGHTDPSGLHDEPVVKVNY